MDVSIRQDLCDEEKSFIQKRLPIVGNCLRSHGIVCKPGEIPRIALLGSGGGERALIALLGVLRQLGQENLLDCFLYLAGVSGSTWAMASLYSDAQWSKHAVKAIDSILNSICEEKGVTFSEGVQWLKKRHEEGDLSLSDVWGLMICHIKGVPLETRTLSDEGTRDAANPYPLYCAIDRALFDKWMKDKNDLWFEMSPHEAGFIEPGAFVKTSLLKQEFKGGHVQYSPDRKPMDMVQLQGICGGVFGDLSYILQYIRKWLKPYVHGVHQIVMALFDLVESTLNMKEGSHEVLARLKSLLGENHGEFSPTLLKVDSEIWTSTGDQERKRQTQKIFEELIESSEQWGQDLKNLNNITDVLWVIRHILPLFLKWNFGTVANFLYQFNDPKVPKEMCQNDIMHLIDAGLFLNSPYPSVLREARDVDVIVSFDFSEEPFTTLYGAHRYAASNKRSFLGIDSNDMDPNCPKRVYVFEEEGNPTVIHIPLFNIANCSKDEAKIKVERKKYETFQVPYADTEMIYRLVDLAADNVKMNIEEILQEIGKAAQRHKQHNIQH